MGDFNFSDINWSSTLSLGEGSEEENFINTLDSCFLYQHVSSPTRIRGTDTPSLLDLIKTNEEEMVNEIKHVAPLGRSDHQVLVFRYNCYADWAKPQTRYNFASGDYPVALRYLQE